jgi:hypothetical protein
VNLSNINIFEYATRRKLRFTTPRGDVTVEDLWNLPLIDQRNPSLDQLAISLNAEIQAAGVSFVEDKPSNPDLSVKFEVVKHVIATKKAEQAMRVTAANRNAQAAQLQEVLARRKQAGIENMETADIERRLAILQAGGDPDAVQPAPAAPAAAVKAAETAS